VPSSRHANLTLQFEFKANSLKIPTNSQGGTIPVFVLITVLTQSVLFHLESKDSVLGTHYPQLCSRHARHWEHIYQRKCEQANDQVHDTEIDKFLIVC
jgi:hypothetical protein